MLCRLTEGLESDSAGESSFDALPSLTSIGEALELTPIHIAFTLNRLRALQIISTVGPTLTIRDMSRLRTLAKLDKRAA